MKDDVLHKGLERDARLLAERVPEDLTDDDVRRIADSLRRYMAEHDVSQGKIAELLGVARSAVSQFLGHKYEGNLSRLVNKVTHLLNTAARKSRRAYPDSFVETTVATRIMTLITQAEAFSADEGKIGAIIGDGGHGKSVCLRAYAEANRNSIYVVLDGTMSAIGIFAAVAQALKVNGSGNLAAVSKRIADTLKHRNVIVMLDEASSLKVKQLNQLRQIVTVKGRSALILAGNRQLLATIMQSGAHESASMDQFTSRLMAVLNLDELASDRDGGLYSPDDIRKLYEYGGIRLTADAVSTLRSICKTAKSGRLRTCSHIIAALHTAQAVDRGGCISAALIISAIEQLQLPVRAWLPVMTRDVSRDSEESLTAAAAG